MIFNSFSPHCPIASSNLPLTLMTLNEWILVNVTGEDSTKYLQSQVTADVTKITEHQHLSVAHCDPKGKMWSNLRLFRRNEGFSFIERRSVCSVQLAEIRKYAVFSKVMFVPDNNLILLGIAGFQARVKLKNLFITLPDAQKPLINDHKTSLLWFEYPKERFLLVTDEKTAQYITETLHGEAQFHDSRQWLALHIEAGIPVIDPPNSRRFIPQATNLQVLGGISFKKGCYIGQEAIARAEFRGVNKRALYCLIGTANRIPEIGEDLEIKIGKNWRRTGTVLATVKLKDNSLLVQAVMSNNLELNSVFRVKGDSNTLSIKLLPYLP